MIEDKSRLEDLVKQEAQELTEPVIVAPVTDDPSSELVIREIEEESAMSPGGLTKNKYIVHAVRPTLDTLFKLSYQYNTSKRQIQQVNNFTGEDIFTYKELLIPYKGQLAPKQREQSAEQTQKEEHERRAACLEMLEVVISSSE